MLSFIEKQILELKQIFGHKTMETKTVKVTNLKWVEQKDDHPTTLYVEVPNVKYHDSRIFMEIIGRYITENYGKVRGFATKIQK